MTETWTYTAHRYAIAESAPTRYRCPKCRTDVGVIKHGQVVNCPKCSLSITLWGNELECAEPQP